MAPPPSRRALHWRCRSGDTWRDHRSRQHRPRSPDGAARRGRQGCRRGNRSSGGRAGCFLSADDLAAIPRCRQSIGEHDSARRELCAVEPRNDSHPDSKRCGYVCALGTLCWAVCSWNTHRSRRALPRHSRIGLLGRWICCREARRISWGLDKLARERENPYANDR